MSAYPAIGRKQFLDRLAPLCTPMEMEAIETAYAFSKYAHRGQYRADGKTRYFEHPKAVAWLIIDELGIVDAEVIVMALLHDTVEDSYLLSPHRVQINFGEAVVRGIQLLTRNPNQGYAERLQQYGSWKVLLVKLADRVHNLRTLGVCDPRRQARKIAETQQHYLPLAATMMTRLPRQHRSVGARLQSEIAQFCSSPPGV